MASVTGRGHQQNPADGLDPEGVTVLVDEALQLFKRKRSMNPIFPGLTKL